ncbi:MAG: transglutaminase-like domain-containing protein [Bacteroidales bacterium]|jgi:hypothetical protein|nr:transglutaminase-like domain-containing protein [Bacteroidales bacterium]
MRKFILPLILLIIPFFACQNNSQSNYPENVKQTLTKAGDNAPELEKVLQHYSNNPEDSLKYRAACFLIGNMGEKHAWVNFELQDENKNPISFNVLDYENYEALLDAWDSLENIHGELNFKTNEYVYDYDTLTSEFLIQNIDLAFGAWLNKPWTTHLSFDEFCAYILPHRSTNEPVGNWREFFMEEYAWVLDSVSDSHNPVEAAVLINNDIRSWFRFDPRFYEHPADQSYTEMLEGKKGRCEDMTNLAIFAMRANGIAVTSDYTPYWANTGNNHAWNAILDKNGNVSIFMGAEANPGEYELTNRWAKVYRKTYAAQKPSLVDASGKPVDSLPAYINRSYYTDVTAEYGDVSDVHVNLDASDENIAYICVFNSGEWKAIHWAEIQNGEAVFTDMARDIVYLPAYYHNKEILPAGNPFILDVDGNMYSLSAEDEIVTLMIGETTYRTTFATTDNVRLDELKSDVTYELFFWNDDWVLFEEKVYEGKELHFDNLSKNAVYWLKAKDGREEERIFTINEAGNPKFW